MSLIRRLTVLPMRHNLMLRAKHVPGKRNIIADALSPCRDTHVSTSQAVWPRASTVGHPTGTPALGTIIQQLLDA